MVDAFLSRRWWVDIDPPESASKWIAPPLATPSIAFM